MSGTAFPPAVVALMSERHGGVCEGCGEASVEHHHHRRLKGMGGDRRPDTQLASNGAGLCRICHQLAHAYPNVGKLLGWIVPQQARPVEVRFLRQGRFVYLNDAGFYEDAEGEDYSGYAIYPEERVVQVNERYL